MAVQFFLGANTPGGFFSYYDQWLDLGSINRYFLIKGSPGNGKSTFMRRVARRLEAKGAAAEYILCSADPGSLDGVYFPGLGAAFVDATPPHAMEPRFPLAVENYLPLTQFINDSALMGKKGEIMELQGAVRDGYSRLYRILSAVKNIREEMAAAVTSSEALTKIKKRAKGIAKRELRPGKRAVLHKRFLSALAPGGETILWDTVAEMSDRVFEIEDSYHQAHAMLSPLLNAALEAGQEVYACYDPMNPDKRLEHIILPGLRLAFVSSRAGRPYPGTPSRRVRLDACIPPEIIQAKRQRLRFLHKTGLLLLDDGAAALDHIKGLHDRLEEFYNAHMDFVSLRALADAYADKLYIDFGGTGPDGGGGA